MMWLPLWIGLAGIVCTSRVRGANAQSVAIVVSLLLWLFLQTWAALAGPSMAMRYWQSTFPPILWLAGIGAYHLEDTFQRLGAGHRRAFFVACATLVILLGRPAFDQYLLGVSESSLARQAKPTEREQFAVLGETVSKAVPAGETVYVWAWDAAVYVHADRSPASRYTYPRNADQMSQILDDLLARPPAAILMPEDSSPEFDRWCEAACYRALNELLMGYEPQATVGRYRVMVRRGPTGADAGTRSGSG
jgi:hypothetical protein